MDLIKRSIPPELAPCGIYCGACPSYGKTCLGCASLELGGVQNRRSKWSCKLRICCYDTHELDYCSQCEDFPCPKHRKKLLDSHPGDPRFQYRRDVLDNLQLLNELGPVGFLAAQREKFTCPLCNGRVVWYDYRCTDCGEEVNIDY